jgi:thiamine-phosphate pyrophosphorylase
MSQNMPEDEPERCRLVLVTPPMEDATTHLKAALSGGDVASVILARGDMDPASYLAHCQALVPLAQEAGAAALVVDDTQVMGRAGADGVFLNRPDRELKDVIARFSPHKIVGCGDARDRHRALELGECNPDFVFFGRLDGDIRPQPHPKNLALAEWWSGMIEIPCVVMGGSAVESVVECVASGAEFVALGLAVYARTDGPQAAVREANRLIDENSLLSTGQ